MGLEVVSLPKSGKNAYYVTSDGMITTLPKNERKTSKSLDFQWECAGRTFWAMHKFTKESGGNQDSQFKEMETLLRNFLAATNPKNILFVIVDGPYYTEGRMDSLRHVTKSSEPRSYAVPIQDVLGIMEKYRADSEA